MATVNLAGIELAFDDLAGNGGTPMVFVHGAMSNRSTFEHQIAHFEGRRRVAYDTRGHGESTVANDGYDVPGLANDLHAVCTELDVDTPVLVGHSLGGATVLQYAAVHPDNVAAAVILDSPIVMPAEFSAGLGQLAAAARSPMYEEAVTGFMGQFAGFEDRPDMRQRIMADVANTPQEVVASCLESTAAFDSEAAAAACQAPVLYVSSGPWFTDVDRFRELTPTLTTAQTVGSGHYHQLEVPDQINAILDRFLELQDV